MMNHYRTLRVHGLMKDEKRRKFWMGTSDEVQLNPDVLACMGILRLMD